MPSTARQAWLLYEPIHALIYFAPETKQVTSAAGLKGGWMGYFATRAAALGPVGPEVVSALFYNFHPAMVARAIPDAWRLSTPERVLSGRLEVADVALRRALGDWLDSSELIELNDLLAEAVEACSLTGRPLFAAHAALPAPTEPHLYLWHACTLLREHRGDGHVASLLAGELGPREAHLTLAATGAVDDEVQRVFRGWSPEEWAEAKEAVVARGLIDSDGRLTAEGERTRSWVEERTDALADEPWTALGPARTERAFELLAEPRRRVLAGGEIMFPNPMGLTK
jgi:hypothetical protein